MLRCAILTTLIHLVQVRNLSHINIVSTSYSSFLMIKQHVVILPAESVLLATFNTGYMPHYLLQPLLCLKENVVGLAEIKRSASMTVSVQEQT